MTTLQLTHLFLGLAVNPSLEIAISSANPQLAALITQGGDEYLCYLTHLNVRYLGRWVGEATDLKTLEQIEKNVYSLVSRLVPDHSLESYEMMLLAVPNQD